MKSSTIKSWKYNNINQELNTDTNYKIENDMKQNNLIQLKPNSFRNSSIEGDGLNNENIKLHSNVNLNDDYYNNFLLNLNKTSQEYVTINKKDQKKETSQQTRKQSDKNSHETSQVPQCQSPVVRTHENPRCVFDRIMSSPQQSLSLFTQSPQSLFEKNLR